MAFGFDLDTDGTTLIANEGEQDVIRHIRGLRAKGATLKAIAEELTERGVATKTRRSSQWCHQAVARILKRQSDTRMTHTPVSP